MEMVASSPDDGKLCAEAVRPSTLSLSFSHLLFLVSQPVNLFAWSSPSPCCLHSVESRIRPVEKEWKSTHILSATDKKYENKMNVDAIAHCLRGKLSLSPGIETELQSFCKGGLPRFWGSPAHSEWPSVGCALWWVFCPSPNSKLVEEESMEEEYLESPSNIIFGSFPSWLKVKSGAVVLIRTQVILSLHIHTTHFVLGCPCHPVGSFWRKIG